MTSTEYKIGLAGVENRPSSRVLKPPGGGHTNLFSEPEVAVNAPRPKYNQQNSSNMNACIGSTDPNHAVEKLREEIQCTKQQHGTEENKLKNGKTVVGADTTEKQDNGHAPARGRVPPGGYSSGGFW